MSDHNTIICDIDGTLAEIEHRQVWVKSKPKNWKAFYTNLDKDNPIPQVIGVINALRLQGYHVIFCTGRPESHRKDTIDWLNKHMAFKVSDKSLFMRPTGDYRDDAIIKSELLAKIREAGYNPTMAFDDRQRVVKNWIKEGIFVFDVSQGNGDF